jgi:tRNA pseudouridine65 synthase
MLPILFEDEQLVVIDKPAGLLVHRTNQAYGEEENALIQLRDQLGTWVAPVHRLDRATSGCLLFAKNEQVLPSLKALFMDRAIEKRYLCIVRGIPAQSEGLIDHPLTSERSGKLQEAQSKYRVIRESEQPFDSTGRYPTSRYSLLEVEHLTGRTYFETHFGLQNLLLHSWKLGFTPPYLTDSIQLVCPPPAHFSSIATRLGWHLNELK